VWGRGGGSLPLGQGIEDAKQALEGVEVDRAEGVVDGEGGLGQQGTDRLEEVGSLHSTIHVGVRKPYKARLVAQIQNHLQGMRVWVY
jgi:hypothetical protein